MLSMGTFRRSLADVTASFCASHSTVLLLLHDLPILKIRLALQQEFGGVNVRLISIDKHIDAQKIKLDVN
jgi:hypothetical protein